MDKDGGDTDMFEYGEYTDAGYEQVYKCLECDNDSWRICVDGTVKCIECTDTYEIGAFIEAPPD